MRRTLILCGFVCAVCAFLGTQDVVSSFQLSRGETSKARQLLDDVRTATTRTAAASAAWQNFYAMYKGAHPELPRLQFTSDLRIAFSRVDSNDLESPQMTVVVLSPQEQQKAGSLYRESQEAWRARVEAEKNWRDYQFELIRAHVATDTNFVGVPLSNGKQLPIPAPWGGGIALTPDCREAIPKASLGRSDSTSR